MPNVDPIPEGRHGVIPHLVVSPAAEALAFYQKAFGAEEVMRAPAPDGRLMHAEMRIGNQVIFLADDFPEFMGGESRNPKSLGGSCVTLHQFTTDTDAAFQRAVDAGATPKMPPMDMFWGDRYATVSDPFGHEWSFATHQRDVSPAELEAATKEAFGG